MLSVLLPALLATSVTVPPTPTLGVPPPPPAVAAAPRPALPPVDLQRLQIARTTANALFRDGSMARMFDQMLSPGPNGYASAFLDMSLGDFVGMVPSPGKTPPDNAEMHTTFREMIARKDPYFDQRLAAIHDAVVAEAIRLGPKFEGPMREGLANSMARRFTAAQLTDMNHFFLTPSGQAFGDQVFSMWMDPAVMKSMIGAAPALAMELPAAMARVKAASDRYPYPKSEKPAPASKALVKKGPAPHRKK